MRPEKDYAAWSTEAKMRQPSPIRTKLYDSRHSLRMLPSFRRSSQVTVAIMLLLPRETTAIIFGAQGSRSAQPPAGVARR